MLSVLFAATLYVSSTATGGGAGTVDDPYTMSEAWTKVKANDTIQLADGVYVEETARGDNACFTVRDKDNITFSGNAEHPEQVVIDFNGTSNRGFYSPNKQFTIRGITFRNKKTGSNRGVIAAGGTITGTALVENCRFINITTDQTSGDGRMGTVFSGGATADFVFRNCHFEDINCYVWGVMYLTAGTLTLDSCTMNRCHTKTGSGSVVGINGGKELTIVDSDFHDVGCELGLGTTTGNASGVLHVNDGTTPSVVLRRCRFWQDPQCGSRLGGFSNVVSPVTVEDCEFYDFKVGGGWAGLFYMSSSAADLSLTRCVVSNCTSKTNAGVIGVNGSGAKVTLSDCRFTDCQCTDTGTAAIGGLLHAAQNFTLKMTDCICEGGLAYNGGQISISENSVAEVSIDRCIFRNEKARNAGAAIFSKAKSGSRLLVRNSLFTGCDITQNASGASCIYTTGTADVKIDNCTFADNCPKKSGTTVAPLSPVSSTAKNYVSNCIFWHNRDNGGEGTLRVTSNPGNTIFANCVSDVSGQGDAVALLTASPFADESAGDYTLAKKIAGVKNPCLDAGATLDWMDASACDLAGKPRSAGTAPDLGCYEFVAKSGLLVILR